MIVILLFGSFFFEGIMSNLFPINSVFVPLFSVVALLVVYPYFNGEKNKFIIVSALYGLLYDIVYTNCLFINTFSFLFTALMIILIYNYVTVNRINFSLINLLIILFYQATSYILLCLFRYTNFNDITFIKGLYSVLISNLIYGIILYLISCLIIKKYKIRTLK